MRGRLLRKAMYGMTCAVGGAWLALQLSNEKRERALKLIHEAGELLFRLRV